VFLFKYFLKKNKGEKYLSDKPKTIKEKNNKTVHVKSLSAHSFELSKVNDDKAPIHCKPY